jgi:dihydroxyacetone kinase phosphotransfer subunit
VIGIVLISHSKALAEGVKELASGMTGGSVPIAAAGGGPDGGLGTDVDRIRGSIEEVYSSAGVLILMDLGSAVMSAEVAVEDLDEGRRDHILLSNAPLVEGAVIAAVEASIGKSLHEVNAAAEDASFMQKVER